MKHCNLNEEQRGSLVTYLLGELPADVQQMLEQHLSAGCPRCEQEMAELSEALTLLAYTVNPASPAESVRTRLMARGGEEANSNPPLPIRQASVPWYRTPNSWLGRIAASIVVLMLLGQTAYLLNIKRHAREQDLAIAQLREQLNKKQNLITTISESKRLIVLDGRLFKASGKAFWDTAKNTWLFYIDKLPPAPKGRVYQLWFITKDESVGGGTFQTDANGRAQLRQDPPHSASPIVATAVSLEPEGGSDQPQGVIYLIGPV